MHTNHYQIAVGVAADIEAIAQFQVDMAMESEGTTLDTQTVLRGVTEAMNDRNRGLYLVTRKESEVVGSLMITREWSDWNAQWYWWVQSVYVAPAHRGKGLFRAMYAKVKEIASLEGIEQVRLYVDKSNRVAQEVYKKVGMEECHYLMYEEVLK